MIADEERSRGGGEREKRSGWRETAAEVKQNLSLTHRGVEDEEDDKPLLVKVELVCVRLSLGIENHRALLEENERRDGKKEDKN